eukprot:CAMPEP_0184755196 /NCGR_PEP_ID=MMETSP0315-20130426/45040_1 /TAXON_ID=101924 /ORGANISM="Rhodosorus marinus, Strain UTEX LB 2760" /LENGTH=296 /DNA_ID=CAMNT_0027234691 /DNA_START=150 /DNA_END=1040 /DNA_ORIENTATION=+
MTEEGSSGKRKRENRGGHGKRVSLKEDEGKSLFGNYTGYKRRRTGRDSDVDRRIELFKREWFAGKDVVDLGCNDGAVLIEIASKHSIKSGIGVEIDEKLILRGRDLLREEVSKFKPGNTATRGAYDAEVQKMKDWVPLSFRLAGVKGKPTNGSIDGEGYPFNITFVCEDMLNESAVYLMDDSCDVVLLLSVTKWIQLHGGDKALKSLFHRIFRGLREGGILILEPQPFHSYKRKIKLHSHLRENYSRIRLKPEKFVNYLTKKVGFESSQVVRDREEGEGLQFNRAIYLLRKGKSAH